MTEFEVKVAFPLSGRGFVIAGNVLKGTVKIDMFVNVQSRDHTAKLKIKAVEFMDRVDGKPISYVALVLSQSEVEEQRLKEARFWVGHVFECSPT